MDNVSPLLKWYADIMDIHLVSCIRLILVTHKRMCAFYQERHISNVHKLNISQLSSILSPTQEHQNRLQLYM